MSKRITLDMPDEMHEALSAHADEAEMTLEEYVTAVLDQYLEDVQDMEAAEAELEMMDKMEAEATEAGAKNPSGGKR